MPRKKVPENGDLFSSPAAEARVEKPSNQHTTSEIWRFVKFYCTEVRQHAAEECKGVIRQIQRLIDKGIGLDEIATALENYAADEWRKSQDPRRSKHIRSFFTKEVIEQWQKPLPPLKPVNPALTGQFTPVAYPVPAKPLIQSDDQPEEL